MLSRPTVKQHLGLDIALLGLCAWAGERAPVAWGFIAWGPLEWSRRGVVLGRLPPFWGRGLDECGYGQVAEAGFAGGVLLDRCGDLAPGVKTDMTSGSGAWVRSWRKRRSRAEWFRVRQMRATVHRLWVNDSPSSVMMRPVWW
jgi:hypothetical protein